MKTIFEIGLREEGKRLSLRKNDYDALLFRVGGVIGTEIIFVSKEQALELAAAINKECGGPVEGKLLTAIEDALAAVTIELNPSNYSHDDVCLLNDQMVEAMMILQDAIDPNAPTEAKPTPVDNYPDGYYQAKFVVDEPTGETGIVRKDGSFWHACGISLPIDFEELIILGSVGELRE